MRALAALLAGLATASPAPASVDIVYAQRPSATSQGFMFAWTRDSGLRLFGGGGSFGVDLTHSRLLLAVDDGVRIYAAPTRDRRGVCFAVDFRPRCTYTLMHGLDPHVDLAGRQAAGSVSGIADDSIVRLEVGFGSRHVRARLGRNAFYLRLRPRSPGPTQLVAFDRSGTRHVYLVRPCPPPPQSLPLVPGAMLVPPVQCG